MNTPQPLNTIGVAVPLAPLANKVAASKVNRYKMREESGRIIGGRNRVKSCGHSPVSKTGIDIVKNKEGKISYRGLQSCGNVWACPECARKISMKRRDEIQRIIYEFLGNKEVSIGFLTLTRSHKITDKFKPLTKSVTGTWREILQTREYRKLAGKYKHLGDIRNLEIKVNRLNGWHPHLHILVFAQCNNEQLIEFGNELIRMWLGEHGKNAGEIGQSFTPIYDEEGITDYMSKIMDFADTDVVDKKYKVADEMTMSHLKTNNKVEYETYTPFDLLNDLDDYWKYKKYKAYVYGIKGTRQLTFSKQVRAVHKRLNGDKTDEQLAKEEDKGEIKMKIDKDVWREIAYKSLQAHVLNKMQYEGIRELILFLCKYDIYTDYHESTKRLTILGKEGAFRLGSPPGIFKPQKDIFYMKYSKRRTLRGVLNVHCQPTHIRFHGDAKWEKLDSSFFAHLK